MGLIPPGMANDFKAQAYARWLATPAKMREPKTVQDLAQKLEVEVTSLVVLHNQPWWPDFVEQVCGAWTPGFSKHTTDTVLEAIAAKAMNGDVSAAKLYLQMAGVLDTRRPGKVREAEPVDPSTIPTAELERLYEGS